MLSQFPALGKSYLDEIGSCTTLDDLEDLLQQYRRRKAQYTASLQSAVHSLVTEAGQSLSSLQKATELSSLLAERYTLYITFLILIYVVSQHKRLCQVL